MTYFSQIDHQLLTRHCHRGADNDNHMQLVYDKLAELHSALQRRFRDHGYDLHAHWDRSFVISNGSVTSTDNDVLTLRYFRSRDQAQLVERLMGRDRNNWKSEVDICRHPVVELRLGPRSFAVELVLSPNAWWDQQNFVGKLGIVRHREVFRSILQRMDGDFRIGFFGGSELDDMHVTTRQISRGNYLNEWMSTFAEGQDWLRVGFWYEPEDAALNPSHIVSELVERIGALYSLYEFLLWTSNNDFHSFYQKLGVRPSSLHHA
jgi:hypothetical protein